MGDVKAASWDWQESKEALTGRGLGAAWGGINGGLGGMGLGGGAGLVAGNALGEGLGLDPNGVGATALRLGGGLAGGLGGGYVGTHLGGHVGGAVGGIADVASTAGENLIGARMSDPEHQATYANKGQLSPEGRYQPAPQEEEMPKAACFVAVSPE
jgi:hypothetical protein